LEDIEIHDFDEVMGDEMLETMAKVSVSKVTTTVQLNTKRVERKGTQGERVQVPRAGLGGHIRGVHQEPGADAR
jgi:hypothetical protein